MHYRTADVAELARCPVARVRALVRAGLLAPERDARGFRFDFRDVVLVRTAAALAARGVPFAAVRHALLALRRRLPPDQPLSAQRLDAQGHRVVVEADGVLYEPDSGQTHIRFEPAPPPARAMAADRAGEPATTADGEALYARALAHEDAGDVDAAMADWRRYLHDWPGDGAVQVNLGRLLQARGERREAQACYRAALEDPEATGIAWFNLGTLHEDGGEAMAAIDAYRRAAQAGIADAHFNLARLHEERGERDAALRHLLRFAREG